MREAEWFLLPSLCGLCHTIVAVVALVLVLVLGLMLKSEPRAETAHREGRALTAMQRQSAHAGCSVHKHAGHCMQVVHQTPYPNFIPP